MRNVRVATCVFSGQMYSLGQRRACADAVRTIDWECLPREGAPTLSGRLRACLL